MCDYIDGMIGFKKAVVVEIGSYAGDSSEIFAQRCGKLFCVDPWVNGYDENDLASTMNPMEEVEKSFDERMLPYANFTKLKMDSATAAMIFSNDHAMVDAVYIDALHTYEGCKKDIELWKGIVKRGGFLCGHDYGGKNFQGVKQAVDEFKRPDITFKDSSWLIRI